MKRRLFKLALFLLLGAVVNVAVAWGCALWSSVNQFSSLPQQRVLELLQERQLFPQPNARYKGKTQKGIGLTVLDFWVSTIVFSRQHSDAYQCGHPWVLAIFAGLPVRSLQAERSGSGLHYGSFIESRRLVGGIELGNGIRDRKMLPLRPIWPGFAINTIFYAAILWVLTLGPFTAQRFVRRKRGHCIKCGYDLRGAEHEVCPECGS